VNLFQRKSAILIVLSWTMLVAAAACWFTGWWWGIFFPLACFTFCRAALPSSTKNGSSRPIPVWIALLNSVAIIAPVMANREFHFVHIDLDALWNHRGDGRLILSAFALIAYRILLDWRYFTKVPAKDIQQFIGEVP
jgi:hypothetical protein